METAKPNFDTMLTELEKLVEQLESNTISLEDSLKTFEKGVSLVKNCQEALKNAEQNVSILLQEKDELKPFAEDLSGGLE